MSTIQRKYDGMEASPFRLGSLDADPRLSQAGGGESIARGQDRYLPPASGRAQLGTN